MLPWYFLTLQVECCSSTALSIHCRMLTKKPQINFSSGWSPHGQWKKKCYIRHYFCFLILTCLVHTEFEVFSWAFLPMAAVVTVPSTSVLRLALSWFSFLLDYMASKLGELIWIKNSVFFTYLFRTDISPMAKLNMCFHKKYWHWWGSTVLDGGHGFLLQEGILLKLVCCILYANQILVLPKGGLENMRTPFSPCYLCIFSLLPFLPSNKAGISHLLQCFLKADWLSGWLTHL